MSSEVGLKICAITAGIKRFRSIMKKRKEKHDKIKFLGKTKLDTRAIFVSKSQIDSYISHDEFVSVNFLRAYNGMNQKIKTFLKLLFNILYKNNGNLFS